MSLLELLPGGWVTVITAAVISAVVLLGVYWPGGAPPPVPPTPGAPTVERICYAAEPDFLHTTHLRVNDTRVDLNCGDRFVVRDGRCVVERGAEHAEVPCVREVRP